MKKNLQAGASLRFGLVGAGRIGQTYAQAFSRTPNACLTAVSDVTADAASTMAKQTGCQAWSSHLELADLRKPRGLVAAILDDRALCGSLWRAGPPS